MKLLAVILLLLPLGGCVAMGVAAGAGAWAAHDYGYHCYNPNRPVAKWCRDHRFQMGVHR
jgi:hypothetical protein